MPARTIYLVVHPEANLSAAEKQELIDSLVTTFGGNLGESQPDGEADDD